jgi:hypothetical protein
VSELAGDWSNLHGWELYDLYSSADLFGLPNEEKWSGNLGKRREGSLMERGHMEEVRLCGRIILKRIFNK